MGKCDLPLIPIPLSHFPFVLLVVYLSSPFPLSLSWGSVFLGLEKLVLLFLRYCPCRSRLQLRFSILWLPDPLKDSVDFHLFFQFSGLHGLATNKCCLNVLFSVFRGSHLPSNIFLKCGGLSRFELFHFRGWPRLFLFANRELFAPPSVRVTVHIGLPRFSRLGSL